MSLILPVSQEGAHFAFRAEIEGITYSFTWRWNDRDGAWFLDLGDGSGVAIISGIKIVINLLLLGGATSKLLPTGDFVAFDTAGKGLDAGFEDLGRRVQVYYFTRAELAAKFG